MFESDLSSNHCFIFIPYLFEFINITSINKKIEAIDNK